MQRQKVILIISGVILALLAVLMINIYLNQQRQKMEKDVRQQIEMMEANRTSVLVAKKDIPQGSTIGADDLEVGIIPNQYLAPQVVTSLDTIAGMVTIAPISKGEQIIKSKLVYPREAGAVGLAQATPIGKRAITISVDNISSLAGMIKPGDYVDVIVMISVPVQAPDGKEVMDTRVIPVFQNILVLAVGQEIGTPLQGGESRYQRETPREASPLITLALSPQEANLIAFLQEQGKIRLVMRHPTDAKIEPLQQFGWDALFQYLMPPKPTKPTQGEAEPTAYVEIYRGLNKEKVPLSK